MWGIKAPATTHWGGRGCLISCIATPGGPHQLHRLAPGGEEIVYYLLVCYGATACDSACLRLLVHALCHHVPHLVVCSRWLVQCGVHGTYQPLILNIVHCLCPHMMHTHTHTHTHTHIHTRARTHTPPHRTAPWLFQTRQHVVLAAGPGLKGILFL